MLDDANELFERAAVPAGPHKRAEISREAFAALPAKQVPCGFFDLTLSDGSHRRFRIRLERGSFLTGQRTLAIHRVLDDPDRKQSEWESIGTVGAGGFVLFKRWRNEWEARWAAALWSLLNGLPSPGYGVEVEPRCWMTMRALTTDESREAGLTRKWRKEFSP